MKIKSKQKIYIVIFILLHCHFHIIATRRKIDITGIDIAQLDGHSNFITITKDAATYGHPAYRVAIAIGIPDTPDVHFYLQVIFYG